MPATILYPVGLDSRTAQGGGSIQFGITSGFGRGSVVERHAFRGNSGGALTIPFAGVGATPSATTGIALAWSNQGNTSEQTIVQLLEGATVHLEFTRDTTGNIKVYRGARTTLLGTSSGVLLPLGADVAPPAYSHIELTATCNDTTGAVSVKINETSVLTLTAQDTRNGATGVFDTWFIDVNSYKIACDIICTDGGGFVGDRAVQCFFGTGDGANTSGTPSSGTRATATDDPTGDNGDTDYVSQDDISLPKAFSLVVQDLPSNAISVLAVAPWAIARKDDAGTNNGRLLLISGATTNDGGADVGLSNAYASINRTLLTDPNTSSAWTISGFNALEVGWRRTA